MSVKHQLTAEDLLDMPEVPGKRFELVDGEVVEVSPAGAEHTGIMFALAKRLDAFVSEHGSGVVMPDGLGFVLRRDPDLVRSPDVSFVASSDVAQERLPEGCWEGSPTLAVEILSPNDRAIDVHAKVQEYQDASSRQVWVLWPPQRSVSVYSPASDTRELGPDSTLDGGDILPGFSVTVSDLFDIQRR